MASAALRLSDRELAQINAAAVTKEYKIKPHLGAQNKNLRDRLLLRHGLQTIAPYPPLTGKSILLAWTSSNVNLSYAVHWLFLIM